MTITVNLPPATIEQLEAEAAATGKDVEKLVREAVQTKLARRKQTFAEGTESLRVFWRKGDAHFCLALTWDETQEFCRLARIPVPW